MYKNEGGFKGLYRGLVPTAAGVAPYVALNFACFESFKGMLTTEDGRPPGTLMKLLVGGVAGSISQTCTYPFDVLRRRMQVVGVKGLGYEYTGAWSATKTIVRTEGAWIVRAGRLYASLSADVGLSLWDRRCARIVQGHPAEPAKGTLHATATHQATESAG